MKSRTVSFANFWIKFTKGDIKGGPKTANRTEKLTKTTIPHRILPKYQNCGYKCGSCPLINNSSSLACLASLKSSCTWIEGQQLDIQAEDPPGDISLDIMVDHVLVFYKTAKATRSTKVRYLKD